MLFLTVRAYELNDHGDPNKDELKTIFSRMQQDGYDKMSMDVWERLADVFKFLPENFVRMKGDKLAMNHRYEKAGNFALVAFTPKYKEQDQGVSGYGQGRGIDADVKVVELSLDKNLKKSRPSKKKRNKMKSQATGTKHKEAESERHVSIIHETPEDHEKITLQYIVESQMSASWVYNLLVKQAEVDRIILELVYIQSCCLSKPNFQEKDKKTGFVVVRDLKWNGTNIENLHLQAIVCRRDIRSVRDLTANELPLLEGIRDKVLQLLEEEWELRKEDVRMYFHYQPSYYHLHIHIIFIEYEAPGLNSTAIDLFTVIDNLKQYPDYYKKATLPFKCKRTDALYQKFAETGRTRILRS